jgi:serine protease
VAVAPAAGAYAYEFSDVIGAKENNVRAGSYLIVTGSDNDNDGFVCDAGEACGAFPTLDLLGAISFAAPEAGLDFGTSFRSAIQALGSAADHDLGVALRELGKPGRFKGIRLLRRAGRRR